MRQGFQPAPHYVQTLNTIRDDLDHFSYKKKSYGFSKLVHRRLGCWGLDDGRPVVPQPARRDADGLRGACDVTWNLRGHHLE